MEIFNYEPLHLSDILGDIIGIRICEDVRLFPCTIAAADDIGNDNDNLTYTLSDEKLRKLSDERISLITDGPLLHRIYKLMPEKLSDEQLQLLKEYYTKTRFEMDEADIKTFLNKLQTCKTIIYDHKHQKTKEFILDSGKKIRDDDCLEIIKSLTVEDYSENMYSGNSRFFGDELIVFKPYADWQLNTGEIITDLCIYVKLDIDLTDGTTVAIISFHDAKYED